MNINPSAIYSMIKKIFITTVLVLLIAILGYINYVLISSIYFLDEKVREDELTAEEISNVILNNTRNADAPDLSKEEMQIILNKNLRIDGSKLELSEGDREAIIRSNIR